VASSEIGIVGSILGSYQLRADRGFLFWLFFANVALTIGLSFTSDLVAYVQKRSWQAAAADVEATLLLIFTGVSVLWAAAYWREQIVVTVLAILVLVVIRVRYHHLAKAGGGTAVEELPAQIKRAWGYQWLLSIVATIGVVWHLWAN
jgi:hypothetical protein